MQLSTLLTLLAAAASVAIAAPFHHHAQVNIQIDLTMEQATAVHSKQPPVTDLSNVAGHSDDHFRDLNFDFRLLASPLYSEDGLYQQLGFEGGKGVLKLGPDTIFRLKNGRLVAYDEKIVGYIEDDEHFPPRAVLVPKIVDRSPAGIEFKAVLDRGAVIYLLFDDEDKIFVTHTDQGSSIAPEVGVIDVGPAPRYLTPLKIRIEKTTDSESDHSARDLL